MREVRDGVNMTTADGVRNGSCKAHGDIHIRRLRLIRLSVICKRAVGPRFWVASVEDFQRMGF